MGDGDEGFVSIVFGDDVFEFGAEGGDVFIEPVERLTCFSSLDHGVGTGGMTATYSVVDIDAMEAEALGYSVDFAIGCEFSGFERGDEGLLHGWGGVEELGTLAGAAV